MSDLVGVERDAEGLRRALVEIARLEASAEKVTSAYLNMTTSATLVAAGPWPARKAAAATTAPIFPRPVPIGSTIPR